jgi:hypothetical protein
MNSQIENKKIITIKIMYCLQDSKTIGMI